MRKTYDYPTNAIIAVQNWFEENENREITEEEINQMEPILVLDIFLEWEGIWGYTDTISRIVWPRTNNK